ncbi:MAG: squalene/phytoene synthase family protein, partial [Alphaproteobacteria bacterium]|nr:squalene/phytoene synthase family protein [Alphaproteobacteria bacterium]
MIFWRAMERDDSFAACGAMVRARDADRYFAALFAPKETRRRLFALYALNYELAHVGESVREPMVGDIRMQWWRETLESARDGHPRAHVVAHALAAAMAAQDLPGDLFERMIEARGFDYLDGYFTDCAELESYAADTAGALMQLALRAVGCGAVQDEAAREAGIAYALCGLLRALPHHAARRKLYLPLDVLAAIDGHAGAGGEAGIGGPVIGPGGFLVRRDIGAVIGIGQLVIVAFAHAGHRHPQLAPEGHFRLILSVKGVVEEFVMPVFVGGDAAGNFLQDGFVRGIPDGRVIGRGAAFDHATGHHLGPAGTANRAFGVQVVEMGGAVALAETGEGVLQSELGIRGLSPAAQRAAVLALFRAPTLDIAKGTGTGVAKHPLQIGDIIRSIILHQGGRL